MSNIIERFYLCPNFYSGFTYVWVINPTFSDPKPWSFIVEESNIPDGPFKPISPSIAIYSYSETAPRLLSPDNNLYFRIKFTTAKAVYYSTVIAPHTTVDRKSFLIIREIMRKELLQQRNMSGVPVNVYIRASFGPYCDCIDPVTKDVLTTRCTDCFGVGRTPGYHGPYVTWATFNPVQKGKNLIDDNTAVKQEFATGARIISVPELKTGDIIIDKTTDRRFLVGNVNSLTELRRVPIVSNVDLRLIPVSDSIYGVGQI